jgi:FkbM family methyltransferase
MQLSIDINLPPVHSSRGYDFFWDYILEARGKEPNTSYNKYLSDLLTFCLAHYPLSKAQLFQDLYVLHKLRGKSQGYFVEFGATNGMDISNTFLLENSFGWTGIIAEPSPLWHPALFKNRKCVIETKCVWKASGEHLQFLVSKSSPELATINSFRDCDRHKNARSQDAELVSVETISLNDLLSSHAAPRVFDYLSVDTEGSELEILQAFDFNAHTPVLISVEHNYCEAQRNQLKALLESKGYVRDYVEFSKWDDWYYHRDLISVA